MDVNAISKVTSTPVTTTTQPKNAAAETETAKVTDKKEEIGAIYEKSDKTEATNTRKPNTALIEKMKAEAEQRTAQLRSIVEQMMTKQGATIANADDMWKFLAKGDFTVSADVKAQAEADIAEDGYWGVEQTSDRIVDFAKALSGGDPAKADEMIEAFKKGFEEATKAWGDELPDISQRTYDAVLEKMDAWKNQVESGTETI